jgi:hypothetical protein
MSELEEIMKCRYAPYFSEYVDYLYEAWMHYADPHPKKALRERAWNEIVHDGKMVGSWVHKIILSFKRKEYGKFGKYPRVYANLGIHSSLRGFVLMEKLKNAMDKAPIRLYGGEMRFVKSPQTSVLRTIFNSLIRPRGRFFAAVFSDDMCLSVQTPDGVVMMNIDISSCDASHYSTVFEGFSKIFPSIYSREIAMLIRQCESSCKIYSYAGKESITIKPKGPFLPSGSVLTTPLNTYVSMHLAAMIVKRGVFDEHGIRAACESIGYKVTVDFCPTYHTLQFLKHSPCKDRDGVIQPFLNLGVLLRLSGTCVGDLPGRGDLRDRGERFQKALLRGVYPYVSHPLINNMKERVKHAGKIDLPESYLRYRVDFQETEPVLDLDLFDSLRRYSLTSKDLYELMDFGKLGFGEFLSNEAMTKILSLDYPGIECSKQWDVECVARPI